jgi:hypothetical protein
MPPLSRHLAGLAVMLSIPVLAPAQITVTSGTLAEQRTAVGQEYLTRIALHNPTAIARVARLTRTEYNAQGGSASDSTALGRPRRSNVQWLTDIPATVTVPPGSTANVVVRVVVPNDSTLRGTYWSAILVETVDNAEPELKSATDAKRNSLGISMRVRYAVQIATHVGDAATSKLDFSAVRSMVDSLGQPVLELEVQNPGERGLRPMMTIELYDAAGQIVSRQQQQRGLLYPGDRFQQRFRFDGLKPGEYTALVLADAGGTEVFGVQLRLRF